MDKIGVLDSVLDVLWENYKQRVSYAKTYNEMVDKHGGKMTNDHIAFRTFNAPSGQPAGIESL